jgi:hypothetical protein
LTPLEHGALGRRIGGGLQKPPDPRRVDRGWGDAVHAHAIGDVIGSHGQRQRKERALRRAVERTVGEPGGGGDRADVDDRRVAGPAQMWECGAAGTHRPEEVHVDYAAPLLVGIGLDVALGADPGVVDQDIEPAEAVGGLCSRGLDGGGVGDVGLEREQSVLHAATPAVQHRDSGASACEQAGGGEADPRAPASHERGKPI